MQFITSHPEIANICKLILIGHSIEGNTIPCKTIQQQIKTEIIHLWLQYLCWHLTYKRSGIWRMRTFEILGCWNIFSMSLFMFQGIGLNKKPDH